MSWSPNTLTDSNTSEEKSSSNGEKAGGLFARQIHDTLTHESMPPRRIERLMPLLAEAKPGHKADDEKIILFDRHVVEEEVQRQKHAAEIVETEQKPETDTENPEDDDDDEENDHNDHRSVQPPAKPVQRPIIPPAHEQIEWPQHDEVIRQLEQLPETHDQQLPVAEALPQEQDFTPAEQAQAAHTVEDLPDQTAEHNPDADDTQAYGAAIPPARPFVVRQRQQPTPPMPPRPAQQPNVVPPAPTPPPSGGGGGRPPSPPVNQPPASPNYGPPPNPNMPHYSNMNYGPPPISYNQYNQYNQAQSPSLAELIPQQRPRAEHVRTVDGLARLGVVLGYFAGRRRDRKLDNKIENNSRNTKANFADVETKGLRFDQQQQRQDRDIRQLQHEQQQMAQQRAQAEQTPLTAVGSQNEAIGGYGRQNPNTVPGQQRAEQFRSAQLEALPPIEPRSEQAGQLDAAEQAAEAVPDVHMNSSAWHNIATKNGREVQGAIEYGRSFQEERKQEVIPDLSTNNRSGAGGVSIGAFSAQPQSPYAPTPYPANSGLPSGMTSPSLPQGLPTHSDPQHQLPEHAKKSGAPGLAFWVMLVVIVAAFFAAALI